MAAVRAFGARGIILSGGPESVTDASAAARATSRVRARCAGARHLLRHADDGGAARRPRRAVHATANSATRSVRRTAPSRLLDGIDARRRRRIAGRPRRLDEPWRPRRGDAAGIHRDCRRRRTRRSRRWPTSAPLLRRPVPPGSHPHACGRRDPRALRARDLRLRCALGRREHRRGRDRARARAGRRRHACCSACPAASTPRSSRRCCIARSATSSPACSWITACCASARATRSWRPWRGNMGVRGDPRGRRRAFLRRARRRGRPGAQAQDHRPPVHRGIRGGVARKSRASTGSPRARSIRT